MAPAGAPPSGNHERPIGCRRPGSPELTAAHYRKARSAARCGPNASLVLASGTARVGLRITVWLSRPAIEARSERPAGGTFRILPPRGPRWVRKPLYLFFPENFR